MKTIVKFCGVDDAGQKNYKAIRSFKSGGVTQAEAQAFWDNAISPFVDSGLVQIGLTVSADLQGEATGTASANSVGYVDCSEIDGPYTQTVSLIGVSQDSIVKGKGRAVDTLVPQVEGAVLSALAAITGIDVDNLKVNRTYVLHNQQ